jgi:hypothetical protein
MESISFHYMCTLLYLISVLELCDEKDFPVDEIHLSLSSYVWEAVHTCHVLS